jgi:ABC-type bacteriocin/lantibiotic exporter with double-glycine peptidase domain
VPFIPQMENVECGAACLAMILARFGRNVPLADLRRACGVGRDGASAAGILGAASLHGLDGNAYQAEVGGLARLPLPLILHWEFRHFLVLENLTAAKAVVMDPGQGRLTLSIARFSAGYTGVAMAFRPRPDFRKLPAPRISRARYLALARACLPALALILLASLCLELAGLVMPLGQKILVDRVIAPRQEAWLWGLGVALAGTAVAQALLAFCRGWVLQNLQAATETALAEGFMGHLLRLPLGFFLQRRSGDLIQRLDSHAEVQSLFTDRSVAALLDTLLLAGYGALMVAFQARLGLLVIGLGLARGLCQWATRKANARMMSAELATAGRAGSVLVESLNALETIKAAGAEGAFVRRWADREVGRANAGLGRQLLALNLDTVLGLANHLGSTLVFLAAGREVLQQTMTLGTFAAFLMLQGLFGVPLASMLEALDRLQFLGSHLRRLDDVMETAVEPSGTRDPGALEGAITLEGASCSYPGTRDRALEGVDLQVRPGHKVALVGRTGAGKSTLARLLLGMHLPDAGRVAFDGLDMRELDLALLRRRMGVVLQETFLLNDTVRANVGFQAPDLPAARIEEAARAACIHDVVAALPLGYDTVIGENGATLSGGQRQRLALARALAQRPAILLLDEATSALDPGTEARVHRNLAGLGCTRIVIAHRLATVRDADLILVLDRGRVVQRGTFQELIQAPGLFRDLARGLHEPAP